MNQIKILQDQSGYWSVAVNGKIVIDKNVSQTQESLQVNSSIDEITESDETTDGIHVQIKVR